MKNEKILTYGELILELYRRFPSLKNVHTIQHIGVNELYLHINNGIYYSAVWDSGENYFTMIWHQTPKDNIFPTIINKLTFGDIIHKFYEQFKGLSNVNDIRPNGMNELYIWMDDAQNLIATYIPETMGFVIRTTDDEWSLLPEGLAQMKEE